MPPRYADRSQTRSAYRRWDTERADTWLPRPFLKVRRIALALQTIEGAGRVDSTDEVGGTLAQVGRILRDLRFLGPFEPGHTPVERFDQSA